jgi:uncharacterized protein YndB with AHSA1/START domain
MIRWPDRYLPSRVGVHVRNELEMPVDPELVWAWLVRAELWPSWHPNSHEVVISGGGPDLGPGVQFSWTTFGVALHSKVEEYAPRERLAWTGRATGVEVYHAWLIERTTSGCHVLTEESQIGILPRLNHAVRPRRMGEMHQLWLERLLGRARTGPPPPVT